MQGRSKRIASILLVILFVSVQLIGVFGSGYTTLQFGSRGNEVSKLQQALQNKGYYNSTVDGIFGPITEKAVIGFQKDSRIRIDGIAGNETQSTLYGSKAVVSRGATPSAARNQTSEDLYWLSRIINAEAGGESYQGKVAVGNVVLNRVQSKNFPNTVKGVIFEYHNSIPQFSPVADGSLYKTPSQESIKAAKDALNGAKPVGNATYFFNPSKAAGSWIVRSKTYVTRIGQHVFYQ